MRRENPTTFFESLGIYLLPSAITVGGRGGTVSALVVLHLEIAERPRPQFGRPASAERSVTTAIILLGKRREIQQGAGTHELLLAAGVSQPCSHKRTR